MEKILMAQKTNAYPLTCEEGVFFKLSQNLFGMFLAMFPSCLSAPTSPHLTPSAVMVRILPLLPSNRPSESQRGPLRFNSYMVVCTCVPVRFCGAEPDGVSGCCRQTTGPTGSVASPPLSPNTQTPPSLKPPSSTGPRPEQRAARGAEPRCATAETLSCPSFLSPSLACLPPGYCHGSKREPLRKSIYTSVGLPDLFEQLIR